MHTTRPYHRRDISTADIIALYKSGLGSNEIAKRFDATQTLVLRRLERAGIVRRTIRDYVPNFVSTEEIVALYQGGLSTPKIAERIGITKHAVLDRLVCAGVPRRNRLDYTFPSGADSHRWKGGRLTDKQGYVLVYIGKGRRRHEHRIVMERVIGRKLKRREYVHHINGIRNDNRPENLVITAPNKHEARTLISALQRRICYLESVLREAHIEHA